MKPITTRARKVVYDLLDLMPSPHQRASLQALLVLFLQARGVAVPEHAAGKSPSALSRFLNLYGWPTRAAVRRVRREVARMLIEGRADKRGPRPILRAVVDLTPLQKTGSFEGLGGLVRVFNAKLGLHLAVLYVEVDGWRVPWAFKVWRGKGSASPGTLALKLLATLPKEMTARHKVMVLADSAFCGARFLRGVRRMGHHAVVGVRRDRLIKDSGRLDEGLWRGRGAVVLDGLEDVPVHVGSYRLKRDGGWERRFVISTKPMRPRHIVRWGKRRWRIEGLFKTLKGRFSLHRFGQGSRLGVYRFLALSFMACLLAHWGHLTEGRGGLPRWTHAARTILEEAMSEAVVESLLREIEERGALLRRHGIEVQVDGCKI